jgi:hypothetical protein
VYSFFSIAFMGDPCPTKTTGIIIMYPLKISV